MSTYKVIQDIEAEDKLIGPLTLKQFIYACIALIAGYGNVWATMNGLWFLIIIFLPPTLFFGFLAFPWMKDQPTEVWLLAKIRFIFRPRVRIWDQAGMKHLVTVTAPPRDEKHYTDGLSRVEVTSRLKALADTLDSRGWALMDANINVATLPAYGGNQSDRLIDTAVLPQEVITYDVHPGDDMLDPENNPTAQHLGEMAEAATQSHKQQVINQLQTPPEQVQVQYSTQPQSQSPANNTPPAENDYWFMRQPDAPHAGGMATFGASPIVMPGQQAYGNPGAQTNLSPQEAELLDKLHQQQGRPDPMTSHLKRIDPIGSQQPQAQQTQPTTDEPADTPQFQPPTPIDNSAGSQNQTMAVDPAAHHGPPQPVKRPMTEQTKADILNLARNNDRTVESLGREANRNHPNPPADEVVVSLH
jgi:hypothetical protein